MPFKKTNKVFAILCGCLLLASPIAMAKTQTIEATGSYQMGENDSIASAKKNAKEDAMRIAAEQAGVYVRSYSKIRIISVQKHSRIKPSVWINDTGQRIISAQ